MIKQSRGWSLMLFDTRVLPLARRPFIALARLPPVAPQSGNPERAVSPHAGPTPKSAVVDDLMIPRRPGCARARTFRLEG